MTNTSITPLANKGALLSLDPAQHLSQQAQERITQMAGLATAGGLGGFLVEGSDSGNVPQREGFLSDLPLSHPSISTDETSEAAVAHLQPTAHRPASNHCEAKSNIATNSRPALTDLRAYWISLG